MFSEWFERRGFTTPPLSAEELDAIVQVLATIPDVWYTFDGSPMFSIQAHRWWNEERKHYVSYKIYFPRAAWKKIRAELSDQTTLENLMRG